MLLWLQLLICLAIIGYAGYYLSRYGDIIADKTGMSASWVGLLLLDHAGKRPTLRHIGLYTPLILLVYLVAMRGTRPHLDQSQTVPVVYPQFMAAVPTWLTTLHTGMH